MSQNRKEPFKGIVTVKNNSSFKSTSTESSSNLNFHTPMTSASTKSNRTNNSSSNKILNTTGSTKSDSLLIQEKERRKEYHMNDKNINKDSRKLENHANNFLKSLDQKIKIFSHQNKKSENESSSENFSILQKSAKEENNWNKFKTRLVLSFDF